MNNRFTDNLSLILQALSLELLFKDYNNSDLMSELQHQNADYLEKIMSQNEEILQILRKEKVDGNRNN